ncbi:universal stress protein [bacterium]|nr:universal stress protein [bacterium]
MIKIENILFPTDFSEHSKIALEYAVDLARQYNAKLYIQHVFDENILDPFFFSEGENSARYFEQVEKKFMDMISQFLKGENLKEVNFQPILSNGTPSAEIVKFARNNDINLIIIATHGRTGLSHFLMGSTAERVVQNAPCPVLTIRHPEFKLTEI